MTQIAGGNMNGKKEKLYIKVSQDTIAVNNKVKIGDIAEIEYGDKSVVSNIAVMPVYNFDKNDREPVIFSILKIIQIIHSKYPDLEIDNQGEQDFIISPPQKEISKFVNIVKVVFVCLIVFFGALFTIMTFNNDVQLNDLFKDVYYLLTGNESRGMTILEGSYSVGIAVGIIVFFNHFNMKKKKTDPTPLQVEMRIYEENIYNALIDNSSRSKEEKEAK